MYFRLPSWPTAKTVNTMAKLKNVLRCYAMGMGIKEISSAFNLSRNTVRKYVRAFQESGLSLEKVLGMSDEHLYGMFVGGKSRTREPSGRRAELDALLPEYAARLRQRGVTVRKLFEEYSREHPDGYRHANFGILLRRYMLQTKAVGHVEHYAGDQMYVDFAGDRLEVIDEFTGNPRQVEVAILPCSHYTYCEAVWSQRKEDLITGSSARERVSWQPHWDTRLASPAYAPSMRTHRKNK